MSKPNGKQADYKIDFQEGSVANFCCDNSVETEDGEWLVQAKIRGATAISSYGVFKSHARAEHCVQTLATRSDVVEVTIIAKGTQ